MISLWLMGVSGYVEDEQGSRAARQTFRAGEWAMVWHSMSLARTCRHGGA